MVTMLVILFLVGMATAFLAGRVSVSSDYWRGRLDEMNYCKRSGWLRP